MSIITTANADFRIKGPPEWSLDGWDFDRLRVPMIGAAEDLSAYEDTLRQWTPSLIDPNMFLSSWTNDENPVWPTVTLHYIGKKRGKLPPGRTTSGTAIQSAEQTGGLSISVLYFAPVSTYSWISNRKLAGGAKATVTGSPQLIKYTYKISGDGYSGPIPTSFESAIAFFRSEEVTVPRSQEMVPGKYWRNENETQIILF